MFERVYLAESIWIEQLPQDLANAIVTACKPKNFNMPEEAVERHTYAFVRKSKFPGLFTDRGGINELV